MNLTLNLVQQISQPNGQPNASVNSIRGDNSRTADMPGYIEPTESVKDDVAVSLSLRATKGALLDEDLVLIERFFAGDGLAFDLLYHRYHDKVFSIARGILFDPEDASDAVQEVFTLVYKNLRRFDRRSRFSTWLFRVAVNRCIQHARHLKSRSKRVELFEEAASAPLEIESGGDPKIELALSALSPSDRALLILFYWEDLSLNEVASSLGCNVNAAKTRLYRARERFRVAYEGLGDYEENRP